MAQGIIALDIDGTLVQRHRPLSLPITDFLASLHQDGWQILFATGRTIRWSLEHLFTLPFPFFLAPYNGACLCSFPDGTMLASAFMTRSDVLRLESLSEKLGSVVYEAGGEERIWYTKPSFPLSVLTHIQNRQKRQKEQWTAIGSLAELPEVDLASVRFFASPDEAKRVSSLAGGMAFRAPTMKDSFDAAVWIVQVTALLASKGQALRSLRAVFPKVPEIAAGDDMNDLDLIAEADIGIAMASAPDELKRLSLVVAPPGERALISALRTAVQSFEERQ